MSYYNSNYSRYEGFYNENENENENENDNENANGNANANGNTNANENDNAATNRKNINNINNIDNYDTLYTVNLNFDADIKNMDANVLSDYINRRLSNHPYYIDVTKIVDIDVNEETNSITVTVSNKDVQDRLIELQNSPINLTNILEEEADKTNYNNQNNKKLENDIKLVNSMYPDDQKYVLEYETPEGQVQLFEYDFDGFNKAKSLNYDKHIVLNGTKKRHFLRNDNDNPFYYDEYMNSEINYVDNEQYNNLNPADPMNVKTNLYNQIPENNNSNNTMYNNAMYNNTMSNEEALKMSKKRKKFRFNRQHEALGNNYNEEALGNNYNEEALGNNYNEEALGNNYNEEALDNNYNEEALDNNYNEEALGNNYNEEALGNNSLNKIEDKNQYLNYFIIFLILVCVLVIFFIIFNYVFKKK